MRRGSLTIAFALALWGARAGSLAAAEEAAPPPAEPESHVRWYGWETLAGVLGWIVVASALPESDLKTGVTAVGLAAIPVAVHAANGEARKVGFWALTVVGGAATSFALLESLS